MLEETLRLFNPWWSREFIPPGIPRPYYIRKIQEAFAVQRAVILYGLRRVGKTTIMKQFVSHALETLPPDRIYFASMDHPVMEKTSILEILRESRSEERRVGKEGRSRWSPVP